MKNPQATVESVYEEMMDSFLDPRNNMPRVIADGFMRHNIRMRGYVIDLNPPGKDTSYLEIAALLNDIWRAYAFNSSTKALRYEEHNDKSAEIAEEILKKLKVPPADRKKICNLIKNKDNGKTKELQTLREADHLAFVEGSLPIWFERGLWLGENSKELLPKAKKILEDEYKSIKTKEGKDMIKKFHEKWNKWLVQKEFG